MLCFVCVCVGLSQALCHLLKNIMSGAVSMVEISENALNVRATTGDGGADSSDEGCTRADAAKTYLSQAKLELIAGTGGHGLRGNAHTHTRTSAHAVAHMHSHTDIDTLAHTQIHTHIT